MADDTSIFVGAGENDQYLLLKYGNRHGLIAGANPTPHTLHLAANTKRIKIGPLGYVLPTWDPIRLATDVYLPDAPGARVATFTAKIWLWEESRVPGLATVVAQTISVPSGDQASTLCAKPPPWG